MHQGLQETAFFNLELSAFNDFPQCQYLDAGALSGKGLRSVRVMKEEPMRVVPWTRVTLDISDIVSFAGFVRRLVVR
jgi:hypothetical protein